MKRRFMMFISFLLMMAFAAGCAKPLTERQMARMPYDQVLRQTKSERNRRNALDDILMRTDDARKNPNETVEAMIWVLESNTTPDEKIIAIIILGDLAPSSRHALPMMRKTRSELKDKISKSDLDMIDIRIDWVMRGYDIRKEQEKSLQEFDRKVKKELQERSK